MIVINYSYNLTLAKLATAIYQITKIFTNGQSIKASNAYVCRQTTIAIILNAANDKNWLLIYSKTNNNNI